MRCVPLAFPLPLPFALALPLALVHVSCRSRSFNPRQSGGAANLASAPAAASSAAAQVGDGKRDFAELLRDLGEVSNTPPADYERDTAKTSLANGTPLSKGGMGALPGPDVMRFPLRYWKEYLVPAGTLPQPLAAKTVLEKLRGLREKYWLVTPSKDDSSRFASMKDEERNKVVLKPGSAENGCIQNVASHWSDLQIHYFCALPRVVRACYRTVAPQAINVAQSQGITLKVSENRRAALRACLEPKPGDIAQFARDAGYGFTVELKEFYETQWTTNAAGDKVNVFDYIMFAQTYAFDPEQEQAVINAFYADMIAPKGKGESHDLSKDPSGCDAVRPPRYLDDGSAVKGVFCQAAKEFNIPLVSEGR